MILKQAVAIAILTIEKEIQKDRETHAHGSIEWYELKAALGQLRQLTVGIDVEVKKQKAIVLLRAYPELSYREIARKVGLTHPTVSKIGNQLVNGRQKKAGRDARKPQRDTL